MHLPHHHPPTPEGTCTFTRADCEAMFAAWVLYNTEAPQVRTTRAMRDAYGTLRAAIGPQPA